MKLHQYKLYEANEYLNYKIGEGASNDGREILAKLASKANLEYLHCTKQIRTHPICKNKYVVIRKSRLGRHHCAGINCYFCRVYKYLL